MNKILISQNYKIIFFRGEKRMAKSVSIWWWKFIPAIYALLTMEIPVAYKKSEHFARNYTFSSLRLSNTW